MGSLHLLQAATGVVRTTQLLISKAFSCKVLFGMTLAGFRSRRAGQAGTNSSADLAQRTDRGETEMSDELNENTAMEDGELSDEELEGAAGGG